LFRGAKGIGGRFGVVPKRVAHRKQKTLSPLVPVRGDRVGGALGATGLGRREAAARLAELGIRVHAQTLDYIVAGQQGRCREDLVKALGNLAGLPWQWLTGELEHLPFIGQGDELSNQNGASRTWPAEAYVRLWSFVNRCLCAVQRDVRREFPNPAEAEDRWPGIAMAAADAFVALADPEHWVLRLVGWQGVEPPDTSTAVCGPAVTGLVNAWELALDPWLAGDMPLNYAALAILGAPRLLTPREDSQSAQPSGVLAVRRIVRF
jgi:hypothetical protein